MNDRAVYLLIGTVALALCAVGFLFRYELVSTGVIAGGVAPTAMRLDRLTGEICQVMLGTVSCASEGPRPAASSSGG